MTRGRQKGQTKILSKIKDSILKPMNYGLKKIKQFQQMLLKKNHYLIMVTQNMQLKEYLI